MTEWTGNEKGSRSFYIDNVHVSKGESVLSDSKQTIAYQPKTSDRFPTIVPAVKQFNSVGKSKFHINKTLQKIYVPQATLAYKTE